MLLTIEFLNSNCSLISYGKKKTLYKYTMTTSPKMTDWGLEHNVAFPLAWKPNSLHCISLSTSGFHLLHCKLNNTLMLKLRSRGLSDE